MNARLLWGYGAFWRGFAWPYDGGTRERTYTTGKGGERTPFQAW